ncbi:hypothetical protein [Polyangium sp. y55x31]|uniref:hypothetical protein n=1 Tax=Polyangium sp. y55x31 TaxID=3042688 RepID=UPI0024821363|nr:hypothetical protein [Polyangium sp. y55x31]MDI1480090.1 hypothetical protein [Polyangium sp. y55x31]
MKTALHHSPLLLLVACAPSGPATETAEPVETWKREALALRKEYENRAPDPWDGTLRQIAELLDKPDPPAVVGPELKILPAGDAPIAWPAPKEGVLTVRYRIERRDCSPGGSDMGYHLAALCPVETPPGTAPVAERIDSGYVGEQTFTDVTVEKIEVPSPRCELRLYARDHHASQLCTARGPKLPASWSGAAVFDAGTIGLDKVRCERDVLADRMLFRRELMWRWERRNAGKR